MYGLGIKWFCRQGKTELKKFIHRVQKNKTKTKQEIRKPQSFQLKEIPKVSCASNYSHTHADVTY